MHRSRVALARDQVARTLAWFVLRTIATREYQSLVRQVNTLGIHELCRRKVEALEADQDAAQQQAREVN